MELTAARARSSRLLSALRLHAPLGAVARFGARRVLWTLTRSESERRAPHQPVEHLMSLPRDAGFTIIRNGDPNEASEAWR